MTVTGTGWRAGDDPVVSDGETWAGVGIYRPLSLTDGSGCSGDWQGRHAAETSQTLARTACPTPAEHGRPTTHPDRGVRPRRPPPAAADRRQCPIDQVYQVAGTSKGYRGISYSDVPKDVVIDFWVVDLDGTTVVVDLWHQIDASSDVVDLATQARDSITFVTSG